MIDTMKLFLSRFDVLKNNALVVQPASYQADTGKVFGEYSLFRAGGKEYSGSKAYCNTDNFNLTIKPVPNIGTGCFVQLSIPKVHNGSNYHPVGEGGTRAVLDKVQAELLEAGIDTDIQQAKLSRLDTFRNIQAEEPYSAYYPLFSLLRARKALQRGYGTTWLVNNTQQEYCIYDKLVEMEAKGYSTVGYPANTIRFEHRLLSGSKIQSLCGVKTVSDMFVGGRYQVIQQQQVLSWRKSLFSHSVEDVVVLGSKQLESEMQVFRDKYPRNWFDWYLKSQGAYYLVNFAGLDVVKAALQSFEPDRMKLWRAVKTLEDRKRDMDMVKPVGEGKTLSTLYRELQSKVCSN